MFLFQTTTVITVRIRAHGPSCHVLRAVVFFLFWFVMELLFYVISDYHVCCLLISFTPGFAGR